MASLTINIDDALFARYVAMARGAYPEVVPATATDQQAVRRVVRHWLKAGLVEYESEAVATVENALVEQARAHRDTAVEAAREKARTDADTGTT